jgi:penicillin-insensitive murein DD-endopeptidase
MKPIRAASRRIRSTRLGHVCRRIGASGLMRLGGAMAAALVSASGCSASPSPLTPLRSGSIGLPSRGVLVGGTELAFRGDGYRFLRNNDRHFGTPRVVHAIAKAAANVAQRRPGAQLVIGDLSSPRGGRLLPHLSHRSGRDVDLVFYLQTLAGVPIAAPDFLSVESDGLAYAERQDTFYRFDVEREWLLVRALLADPDARVQWMFCSRNAEALLLRHAASIGEPATTIAAAASVLLQPEPGGVHDDHLHVRFACTAQEFADGCEPSGPTRGFWNASGVDITAARQPRDIELVQTLLMPLPE